MKLTDLAPAAGAKGKRKRVGRGHGSGVGKTSGRGANGQKARSGYKSRAWFEGGQMPLQRRVPKRGFHNVFRTGFVVINVDRLNRFDEGTEVTPQLLADSGLVSKKNQPIKVLGTGTLEKKLGVRLHAASAQARKKIEVAGGSFERVALRLSGEAAEKNAKGPRRGDSGKS